MNEATIAATRYEIESWKDRRAVANDKIKYITDELHKIDRDITVNIVYRDDEESLLIHFCKGQWVVRCLVGVEDDEFKMDTTIGLMLEELYEKTDI